MENGAYPSLHERLTFDEFKYRVCACYPSVLISPFVYPNRQVGRTHELILRKCVKKLIGKMIGMTAIFFLLLRSRGWGLGGASNAAQSDVSVADRTMVQAT